MPARTQLRSSRVEIRAARPDDTAAVYDICLRTGDAGGDASALVDDTRLFGHVYAGAYLRHAPETSFVVEDDVGVAGYVLGATDSTSFARTLEERWWPPLRRRYPADAARAELDAMLVGLIHAPPTPEPEICASHPSHLHIDLLPRAQGRGLGRRLMDTAADTFAASGSTGLHVRVSTRNSRAIDFYRHLGMEPLRSDATTITFGWALPRR